MIKKSNKIRYKMFMVPRFSKILETLRGTHDAIWAINYHSIKGRDKIFTQQH